MAVSLKHKFTSAKTDGIDSTRVQPSNWNDEHDLEMATGRLLGRTAAGVGPAQEITPSADFVLAADVLSLAFPTTALAAIAALPLGSNQLWTFHSGGYQRMTISPYMRGVNVSADAAAARTLLGLGPLATQNDTTVSLSGSAPTLTLNDTSGTPATHQMVDVRYDLGDYSLDVRDSAGGFAGRGYQMTAGATGALSHSLNVGAAERLRVEDFTTRITVAGGLSGGIQTGFFVDGGNTTLGISGVQLVSSPEVAGLLAPCFQPRGDGNTSLGRPSRRFSGVYVTSAPNVSSDARLKENIADFTEVDLIAARHIRGQTFTIKATGKSSSGLVAQQIIEAFTDAYIAAGRDGAAGTRRPFDLGLISDGKHYGVCYELVNNLRIEALARSM